VTLTNCSLLQRKPIEVVSKPVQLQIIHPQMPREIDLGNPSGMLYQKQLLQTHAKK